MRKSFWTKPYEKIMSQISLGTLRYGGGRDAMGWRGTWWSAEVWALKVLRRIWDFEKLLQAVFVMAKSIPVLP